MSVSRAHAEKHYEDLKERPFFPGLCEYSACPISAEAPRRAVAALTARLRSSAAVCSGPVVAMVWEGKDVVKQGRAMIGATNPLASAPGTIRGDFCIITGRNVIHGSDAVESAQREIALWFPEGVCSYTAVAQPWIYE